MALTEKLTAIADAVRSKTGKTDLLKLDDMPNEIASISSLADLPEEMFAFSGICSNLFANESWGHFIKYFGNLIKITDATNCSSMFSSCSQITNIPFEINMIGTSHDISHMFQNCAKLKSLPKIKNCVPINLSYMFQSCRELVEIPQDFLDAFDWSEIENSTSNTAGNMSSMCAYCFKLRKLPMSMYKKSGKHITYFGNTIYQWMAPYCYSLDEIVDIPIPHESAMTSNMFGYSFPYTNRIKRLTFETPNGKPLVAKWKGQTIDLYNSVGYGFSSMYVSETITLEDEVRNDEQYQALKNTENWWTMDREYSRYNHDSAVETINSLPNTSAYLATAGGTNTIRFNKISGNKTDGGAIGNLTAEEIAVATAKGWTVGLS